jgi:hypothetical protein
MKRKKMRVVHISDIHVAEQHFLPELIQPNRNRRRGKGNNKDIPDVFKKWTGAGVGEKER